MVVHKETKPSPLRKGIVSCETQESKMTGSGFTARQRIRKLTWHGSFMQTDLTHTTSNMLNASDKEEETLKMGDNSYSKPTLLKITFQSPTSHIRVLPLFSFVSLLRKRLQVSSQQIFSVKSQTINILGFLGHSVSVATTQPLLRCDSMWQFVNRCVWRGYSNKTLWTLKLELYTIFTYCEIFFFWFFFPSI